ncbi:MAG: coproporphyrinogen dehydrogenase HemZ [Peptococcaceae bacterium]|jgi:oxygen-independent coproporphyrinogen-3 oxidase|nr:coproporphyrinogen dehydrogenase HemZ [Peptococcaceae bacterium]
MGMRQTCIYLNSTTLPPDILAAGTAILRAYAPQAKLQTISQQDMEQELDAGSLIRVERVRQTSLAIDGAADGASLIDREDASVWRGCAIWAELIDVCDRDGAGLSQVDEAVITSEEVGAIAQLPLIGRESFSRILVKQILLRLLVQRGFSLPWGILTGMRPAKLLQRMEDAHLDCQRQAEIFSGLFRVTPSRIALLQQIAAVQEETVASFAAHPQEIALYVGIPFCPSRCSYCSFPGTVPAADRADVCAYLQALHQEIAAVGLLMREQALVAGSVYIGGGTPTMLNDGELDHLLERLRCEIPWAADGEFTVEAGRPDTIRAENLLILQRYGVNRLSINPQSMNPATLRRIGREHRTEDIVRSFELARALGFWLINMDVILGLPQEGLAEVRMTLDAVGKLQPDNLTVHALAIKRGARDWEGRLAHVSQETALLMQELSRERAEQWGMRPYYLYRQKFAAGHLENIGYAKPGMECRYNISIIEERQHIIGLGAGASNKIFTPDGRRFSSYFHPVNLPTYGDKWRRVHEQRIIEIDKLRSS